MSFLTSPKHITYAHIPHTHTNAHTPSIPAPALPPETLGDSDTEGRGPVFQNTMVQEDCLFNLTPAHLTLSLQPSPT